MRLSSSVFLGLCASIALVVECTNVASANLIIDNFESYTNGQKLSTGASSTPWLRTGNAVSNDLAATTSAPLAGNVSGSLAMSYNQASNYTNANWRYNYGSAHDLSTYSSASVLMTSALAGTATTVQLAISNGTTTYLSSASLALTNAAQTITFSLTDAFTRASGSESFATVLQGATSIGFKFTNTAVTASETIKLDDFTLVSNPVPEPAGLAVLGSSALVLLKRRKRQL